MFRILICLFLVSLMGGTVQAQAPAAPNAPSNFRVKPLGVNSFLLEWNDNSNNESGWDILVGLQGQALGRYTFLPSPNQTSYVLVTDDFPGKTLRFQIAAYIGTAPNVTVSNYTAIVSAKALSPATFGAPIGLTARTVDDGQIRVSWTDRANSEAGYEVQYQEGTGDWVVLGNTDPGLTFSFVIGGFSPQKSYTFRTRAFRGNPAVYTAFSNLGTATTQPFLAPSQLVSTPEGEGEVSFRWRDRSSLEEGYELEWKVKGSASYQLLGTLGANTSSTTPVEGFSPRTEYEFRIRGFRTVDSVKQYTAYSNVSTTRVAPIDAPTNLAATVRSDSSIFLKWADNTLLEQGYEIQSRVAGTATFTALATVPANRKYYATTLLKPGTDYEFRVRAFDQNSYSNFSNVIAASTNNGVQSDLDPPIFWNTSFLYTLLPSRPAQLSNITITGLPAGLTWNATLRRITGKTRAEGVRLVKVTLAYKDGYRITKNLVLRIVRPPAPPVAAGTLPPVSLPLGQQHALVVSQKFRDPDVDAAVRVFTSLGNFDIVLYAKAVKRTVANFLKYVDAGRYAQTFIHRSVSNFVIQGGGFKALTSGFSKVASFGQLLNEPGVSNLVGTVAMAKLPGNPNSATSEFFVNVTNANASNLDNQNGGFTVFGRIAGNGMGVVNQINGLPVGTYNLSVSGTQQQFSDVPINANSAPTTLDPTQLVKVTAVRRVSPLSFTVVSTNPAVATATLTGTNLQINAVAKGQTIIRIKATDLDGNDLTRGFVVTVP